MDYVRLGATGLKVSRICLGCMTYGSPTQEPWMLGEAEALPFYRQAFDAGITFFDTADVYSVGESERITGKAIKEHGKRDELVIATKVNGVMGSAPNSRGLSRKHILEGIDNSLKRLGTDYVDLYQIHRFDYETPIEETLEALNDVVRAGKARYIGASSMFAWQFSKMLAVSRANGWSRFVSMQPQYNLVYREEEREILPLCAEEGIGVIPWSPLARGFVAGGRIKPGEGDTIRSRTDYVSDRLYYTPADFAVVEAITRIAKDIGATNVQVALAWLFSKRVITAPIIGASKPHHIQQAVDALQVKLDANQIAALEEAYLPKPVDAYLTSNYLKHAKV